MKVTRYIICRRDKALLWLAFDAKCKLKKEHFKSVQDFFNKFLLVKNRAAWAASIVKQVGSTIL